jgi:hypothetical protein
VIGWTSRSRRSKTLGAWSRKRSADHVGAPGIDAFYHGGRGDQCNGRASRSPADEVASRSFAPGRLAAALRAPSTRA